MFETKNMEKLNRLFDELVPNCGKATSLAGELVRAAAKIGFRFFNDGDHIGIGYGKETCNAAARFLGRHGDDEIADLISRLWGLRDEAEYESYLNTLIGAVVNYVDNHPELRAAETKDMYDYEDPDEDRDDGEDEEEC